MSSKAADVLLETGTCFKRIADLTSELLELNSFNRLSSSTSTTHKTSIDPTEMARLRDALHRFSSDLDAVSQRIHNNREAASAPHEVERLMSLNLTETNAEQHSTTDENNLSMST
jgi:predicted  nucleic acid-binding Zn-ribbon protein